MNDTVKLVLLVAVGAAVIFSVGQFLGIDWVMTQASLTLAFVELVGKLLLLFTGSAAAIEVAKYYRRRNREEESSETERLDDHARSGSTGDDLQLDSSGADAEPRIRLDTLMEDPPDIDAEPTRERARARRRT